MHDRLFIDCHVATMVARPGDPVGAITDAAIAVAGGRVARVGPATEIAGERAAETVSLGGAWVTPGLVDCHTHLVFGLLLSGLMSFLVSGIATARALGLSDGFVANWLTAWLGAWAVAFPAMLVVAPVVRRLVARLCEPPP